LSYSIAKSRGIKIDKEKKWVTKNY
jgi:hypothetical protein